MDEVEQAARFLNDETERTTRAPWWLWLLPVVSTLAGLIVGLKINH